MATLRFESSLGAPRGLITKQNGPSDVFQCWVRSLKKFCVNLVCLFWYLVVCNRWNKRTMPTPMMSSCCSQRSAMPTPYVTSHPVHVALFINSQQNQTVMPLKIHIKDLLSILNITSDPEDCTASQTTTTSTTTTTTTASSGTSEQTTDWNELSTDDSEPSVEIPDGLN